MKKLTALSVLCMCLGGCFVPVYSSSDGDSNGPTTTTESAASVAPADNVEDAPPEQY